MSGSTSEDDARKASPPTAAPNEMPFDPYDERATMLCDDRSHLNANDPQSVYMARKHCKHPKITFQRYNGTIKTIHQRLLDCEICTETEGSCSPGAQTPLHPSQSLTGAVAEPTPNEKAVFERMLEGAFEKVCSGVKDRVKALCDARLAPRTLPATPQDGAGSGNMGFRVREEDDWEVVDIC
ncbi:hypothetical protein B0A54_00915 [Friedmanniomyces endolithicus]|uniref:Uncharacterized protein n=1 Tax=Friedmanniomyces endolithicus TaxID=329885 RepID=A0A4V5N9T7_9PEZI|nr:hypothetical protein LTS09_008904 [Friedmanniomyces endolithicus]TKA48839.1 hypothetical protein B0A54_00915 [Friedmanniomyces endolithicus]